MTTKQLQRPSRVVALADFFLMMGVSRAKGKREIARDPDFPRDQLLLLGANRYGITETGIAIWQDILRRRAQTPLPVPANLKKWPKPKRAASAR